MRKRGSCAEKTKNKGADADANGGAKEPGEEDSEDDQREHGGEILAGWGKELLVVRDWLLVV
jgi:hypothetical protein